MNDPLTHLRLRLGFSSRGLKKYLASEKGKKKAVLLASFNRVFYVWHPANDWRAIYRPWCAQSL